MKLNVVLETEKGGWIVAYVPALKGCVSQGRTREEALDNIRDAVEGWLLVEQEKRGRTPKRGTVEVVAV